GPMMGQANVFYRYFSEKIPAAIERYQKDGRRLFEVLDSHLAHHEYLADEYSIADIATWPWVRIYDWSGISIEGLPHLQAWMARMAEKPACQKGITIPPRKEQPDELIKQAQQMVTR
ncbi:MAG: glutathione S-transferase C-terminal domain-containing protein, partial [Aeromonas sobria]